MLYSRLALPHVASEEASLAAPVFLGSNLRWWTGCERVLGSRESHYLGLCEGGGMEKRQGLLLPQGSLLSLLANSESCSPQGTPLRNGLLFLSSGSITQTEYEPLCCRNHQQWPALINIVASARGEKKSSISPPCGLLFSLAFNMVLLIRLNPQTRGHFKLLVLIFSSIKSNYLDVLMTAPSGKCFSTLNSQSFCQELMTLRLFSPYKL